MADESVGVRVGMRMRPMVGHEKGQKRCINISSRKGEISIMRDALSEDQQKGHPHEGPWQFDLVMDSSDKTATSFCGNDGCYKLMGRPLVDQVLKGYNCCLFCYGQTGTGKTATIMGYPDIGKGLLPQMLEDICAEADKMRQDGSEVSVKISMFEIYNEKVHDLLVDRDSWSRVHVKTTVLPTGVRMSGMDERTVTTLDECIAILEEGDKRKTVAATAMNPVSSRGHMVFKLTLEKTGGRDGTKLRSEVYFADLAGHENIKETCVTGERLTELRSINSSLMYLQRAIHTLATTSTKKRKTITEPGKPPKEPKVNYSIFRNSELTLLLANGLTGNSCAAVIVTLSPANRHFETSLSSIEFALEVKGMKMDVHSNVVIDTGAVIKKLENEVQLLKGQLSAAQAAQSIPAAPAGQQLNVKAENMKPKNVSAARGPPTAGTDDRDRVDVKTSFRNASKLGNGKISKDACFKLFSHMFPTWSAEELSMFFDATTVDSNGAIDFENWVDWIYDANAAGAE